LLKKWEAPVVIGARFIPGFSSTTTIAVALSAMSSLRFLTLNSIGALAWALTFGILGYALGEAIEELLGDIQLRAAGGRRTACRGSDLGGLALWTNLSIYAAEARLTSGGGVVRSPRTSPPPECGAEGTD
jgi:hypothetical protein